MNEIIDFLINGQIPFKENEPMKLHTSFKTGGNARLFVSPESEEQLSKLLAFCNEEKINRFIIGNGSNLLVDDCGIDGIVIEIGDGFDCLELVDETTIKAGAGTSLAKLCRFALSNSLSGLEFAFGIPGSVGGAAFMNAGAYGGEMKDVAVRVNHISADGKQGCLCGEELSFGYRSSAYTENDCVITSVVFNLKKSSKSEIEARMNELLQRRKDKQPLDYPSAGSVFKRPEGYFAGALIEQSGLKGKRIGGAMVSEKHAGFIINYENATSTDVKELIAFCQKTVFEKFGVKLSTEIKMI